MKRKKGTKAGYKKGKKKGRPVVNDPAQAPVSPDSEDDQGLDENDNSELDPKKDVVSAPVGPDQPSNVSDHGAGMPNEKATRKSGYGRVKVKIRSSRISEPQSTYSDAQTHSETDTSTPQVVLETHASVMERREGSSYSDGQTSDLQMIVSGKPPRKAGSIKIISSRAASMQDKHVSKQNSPLWIGERPPALSDNEKSVESSVRGKLWQGETKLPYLDLRYNEKELSSVLTVIRKVMKMDAAEPFNAPVDPIALGIPDYFDIIKTPMDFGTICDDLEHRRKYFNSEDVYKDVQFIWENCYKYNNKGDYILDLMKRVKKNFTKYWMAAGLYSDLPGVNESTQVEDPAQSGHEKLYLKLKDKYPKHKRRRYGINHHKSGCLCAVCVVRRRRKEREGTSVMFEDQMASSESNLPQDLKQEESSPVDNIYSDHTSSSLDQSLEPDATADLEEPEQEEKVESPGQPVSNLKMKREAVAHELELPLTSEISRPFQLLTVENGTQEDSNQPFQGQEMELDLATPFTDQKDDMVVNPQVEAAIHHHTEAEESEVEPSETDEQIESYEGPSQEENHSILQICSTLFTRDPRSLWRGPHSLNHQRHVPMRSSSPIRAAVSMFFK